MYELRRGDLGAYTAVESRGGGVGSVAGGAVAGAVGHLPALVVAGVSVAIATYVAAGGIHGDAPG